MTTNDPRPTPTSEDGFEALVRVRKADKLARLVKSHREVTAALQRALSRIEEQDRIIAALLAERPAWHDVEEA